MSKTFFYRQNKIYQALLTAFLAFVIVFIGHHLWTFLHKPYVTETAVQTTLVDEIALDGFFVRDEQMVTGGDSGVMKCNYEDGQRVRKGSIISSLYQSQQDQINLQLVEEFSKQYEQLQELSGEGAVKGSRIDIIVKQIEQLQLEYAAQIEAQNYVKASELKDDLTYQLNKLLLCKGEVSDYSDAMDQLQSKISALSASSETKGKITAPVNGYFSGKTDGLEDQLNLSSCKTMSPADAIDILSVKTINPSGIGKIVTSNYWYYCAVAKTSDLTEQLYPGKKVNVDFGSLSSNTYPLKLIRKEDDGTGNTLLVFESSIMNKNFINARFEKASITLHSYKGIGINKKAIRFKDKQKGVYIVRGSNVLFRKVDPVYEDEDIVISKYSTDAEYVSLYDNIIVGGELINGGS